MKDALSLTTIFQFVILFILLFTGIMALTINNSNAFGVKDAIVNAIEYREGNYLSGSNLLSDIVDEIQATTYRTTGRCNTNGREGFIGYDRNGRRVASGASAAVCIREVPINDGINRYLQEQLGCTNCFAKNDSMNGVYYQVEVFYQLDLPVIEQVYNFSTIGETKIIYKN